MVRRIFVLLMASALLSFMPATPLARAIEQTKLDAMLTDSLVFIGMTYRGWVRVEDRELAGALKSIGEPAFQGPFEVGGTCTGFVVDPSGYIATAGHCVNPLGRDIVDAFRLRLAEHLLDTHGLSAERAKQVLKWATQREWVVEGKDRGAPPDRTVTVVQPLAPGRVINNLTTVEVVAFQNFTEGDNALLKINGMPPLKSLVVADAVPKPGKQVTSAGFPGVMTDQLDPTRLPQPSFKTGTVSSVQPIAGGGERTEISAAMASGMSGGPTVDNDTGQVLGVNSYSVVGESGVEQNFNMITDTPALRAFLQQHGVHLAQPAAKKAFPWIWVIVGVVAAAVVAGLMAAWLWLRRRGRRQPPQGPNQPQAAQVGTQPPGGGGGQTSASPGIGDRP